METRETIAALESRQLELQATMKKSDAHASKCIKLGLKFSTQYPEEFAEYKNVRDEYNINEVTLAGLYEQLENEAVEIANHEENE